MKPIPLVAFCVLLGACLLGAAAVSAGDGGPSGEKESVAATGRSPAAREDPADGRPNELVIRQMAHEEDKHRRRIANLERVRALLQAAGNTPAVERADRVLARQLARHHRTVARRGGVCPATLRRYREAVEESGSTAWQSKRPRGIPDGCEPEETERYDDYVCGGFLT